MIGTKTLSEIRQQLKAAWDATGDDPIQWLEQQMASPQSTLTDNEKGNEVLQSLQRFLKAKPKTTRRSRRIAATK
ncbi:MAG: hypothetical protein H7062_07740 [Candidatus Saccharimonas sp.]|nr:hypothetical protein [Planctomycetaceae bacterium]